MPNLLIQFVLEVQWVSKNSRGDTSDLCDLIRSECFQKDTEVQFGFWSTKYFTSRLFPDFIGDFGNCRWSTEVSASGSFWILRFWKSGLMWLAVSCHVPKLINGKDKSHLIWNLLRKFFKQISSFDLGPIWTQICSLVARLSSFVITGNFTVPSVSINATPNAERSMWAGKVSNIIAKLESLMCNLLWCQILHILSKCWIFSP